MKVTPTSLPEVLVIEPKVFGDARGFFTETFHAERYAEAGLKLPFVQDNWSRSGKDILRGLHFQLPRPQGKLVMVVRGAVFDVAVDIRKGSPNFGRWAGVELSGGSPKQFWIPPGFAHGFCTLTDEVDMLYKCTDLYFPSGDRGVLWNDPDLKIDWPVKEPKLSAKDSAAPRLKDAPALPQYEG